MAKGNPFMGTINGRIGDNVLYVSKGEQNIIKYQKNISNPRSNGQMYQRARFSNAGRFFTRGRKAFFKFAFEGKKSSQSDFNAFMKANINRSVLISKSALKVDGYPAIGSFIMCQGSLASVTNRVVNDYWQAHFGIPAQSSNPTTIGQLSQLLIETGSYLQGDILTFVFIITSGNGYVPSVKPSGNYYTNWQIKQFRVNVADSTPLEDYEMRAVTRNWNGTNLLTLTDLSDSQILATSMSGFCCVHSRNTTSGLKVSTQTLALAEGIQEAYGYCMTDEYIQQVIEDWKETDEVRVAPSALLKGAISYSPTAIEGITLSSNPDSPFTLNGAYFNAVSGLEDGEDYVVGYIEAASDGSPLEAGRFSAESIKNNNFANITFTQVNDYKVAINLHAAGEDGEVDAWRILMRYNGGDRPISNVTYFIGEIEPEYTFSLERITEAVIINDNVVTIQGNMPTDGTPFFFYINSSPKVEAEEYVIEQTLGETHRSVRIDEAQGRTRAYFYVGAGTTYASGNYQYKIMFNDDIVAIINFMVA